MAQPLQTPLQCSQLNTEASLLELQKAVELTDGQTDDILHLRRVLRCKQGQMARERKALLSKMACNQVESMDHVSDKFSELTQWSEQLRMNAVEEFHVDIEFCIAYYTGVRCTPQASSQDATLYILMTQATLDVCSVLYLLSKLHMLQYVLLCLKCLPLDV